ncbi:nucleotide-binding protein [Tindallia californiensis]|uniref:nitrogenase n=1 Tax=Tindallia californiensis TaxID=159292 RepID=A0A1H3R6N2_9FIRM|nr:AAA family ATPase [Tindallia californiensis]SDZ20898.1 nitrogenase iron protein NifH [Tindallia californiensis]
MRKIAFYGKGGIGKSTLTSSIAAAIASRGYRVMQIGCDPKADSTMNLTGGEKAVPIVNYLLEKGDCDRIQDIATMGYKGIVCFEAGGPKPGTGCAGRGIVTAFELLNELDAFEMYQPDFVLYDVLGDVVCGGFAMPIRNGYAEEVVIITSGEKMALFAAGNIKMAMDHYKDRNYATLRGLILNKRNIDNEETLVRDFAESADTEVIGIVERDAAIQTYEEQNKTVIEGDPSLPVSKRIFEIADTLIHPPAAKQPLSTSNPLEKKVLA